ncbi:dienelactone hydrolase family protein [Ramlibacter humi]|uniref:Alpha/beta hydrolase n=1 Tax=Ramlibacter humi TaxID=2530451 RepID=A0A4Z0BD27_9BURK|nr:alpha/beta family hydrolase [Ramlibacter humi]TFY96680.1 alpha/beta hydrolase [Ramlibacter humi]
MAETLLQEEAVAIPVDRDELAGDLVRPPGATALVLFAHGSGSTRHSPRNRWVASQLQEAGLGTLLFDLLTPGEQEEDERTRIHRFDIELLSERLRVAAEWALALEGGEPPAIGFFGASTGAAAALSAAAEMGSRVGAIVCRGGRPDLAGSSALAKVRAPTLLIVGETDREVVALNASAFEHLRCHRSLAVVPRAGHLFEEPGTLEIAAQHACSWFTRHLMWDQREG